MGHIIEFPPGMDYNMREELDFVLRALCPQMVQAIDEILLLHDANEGTNVADDVGHKRFMLEAYHTYLALTAGMVGDFKLFAHTMVYAGAVHNYDFKSVAEFLDSETQRKIREDAEEVAKEEAAKILVETEAADVSAEEDSELFVSEPQAQVCIADADFFTSQDSETSSSPIRSYQIPRYPFTSLPAFNFHNKEDNSVEDDVLPEYKKRPTSPTGL